MFNAFTFIGITVLHDLLNFSPALGFKPVELWWNCFIVDNRTNTLLSPTCPVHNNTSNTSYSQVNCRNGFATLWDSLGLGIKLFLCLFCFLHRAEQAPHASGGYFTARSRHLILWRNRNVNLIFVPKWIRNHRRRWFSVIPDQFLFNRRRMGVTFIILARMSLDLIGTARVNFTNNRKKDDFFFS